MTIMTGLGRPDFTTAGLSPERMLPVEPMEFTISGSADKKKSRKFVDGKLVTAGTALGGEEFTMKVGIEAVNWLALQFGLGELAQLTASIALPELRYGTVPFSAPYEVADPDLLDANVFASLMGRGAWGESKPLKLKGGAVAPAALEFKVDSTEHKLSFNAALAGAPFAYRVFKVQTNLESIGAEPIFEALSAFAFSGIIHTDEGRIRLIVPKIVRNSAPSLNIGDVAKLEIEFDLVVANGNRSAFKLFKLPD